MKIPSKISAKWVVALLLVSVVGTAAAVTVLFNHHFPSVPTTVTAVLATTCGTPGALTPTPISVVQGSTNNGILFNCNGSTAFTIAASGTATPTMSVGGVNDPPNTIAPTPEYSDLRLIIHSPGATSCNNNTPFLVGLASGVALSFGTAGGVGAVTNDIDYCAIVVNPAPATALSAFDVQWTQA